MKILRTSILLGALALTGCTPNTIENYVNFYPISEDEFTFVAWEDLYILNSDQENEAERRKLLATYVSQSGMCPRGYEIVDVYHPSGELRGGKTIGYRGRCL